MKLIKTDDAVGTILSHDLTQIITGGFKGPRFRKGHVVTPDDIPVLLSMGKENLYVWELAPGMLHEDDAASLLCDLCQGQNLQRTEAKEGKIELNATVDGLFTADVPRLLTLNSIDEILVASLHNDIPVQVGEKVAALRVRPLMIAEDVLSEAAAAVGKQPIFDVLPYQPRTASILVTGNEVSSGLITDTFSPALKQKMANFPVSTRAVIPVGDEIDNIVSHIHAELAEGSDLILCTGGMSVDPDDRTPAAIRQSGAQVVTYGTPVFPGAMFMLGYYPNGAVIMGLPGGVIFSTPSVFDLILPRVMANQALTKLDFASMGLGGLL